MFEPLAPQTRRRRRRQRRRQQLATGPHRQSGACPQCDQPYCGGDSCMDIPDFVDSEPAFRSRSARRRAYGRRMQYIYEYEPAMPYFPAKRDAEESQKKIVEEFEEFRRGFYHRYRTPLDLAIPGLQAVRATALNPSVMKHFMKHLANNRKVCYMSFHGTKEHNIQSISSRGLLVPGRNGVRVANGSSHGVGIYSGMKFEVSQSYCNARKMFACAVVDGTGECFDGKKGRFNHKYNGRSKEVKHCGNFIVIFNEYRVVPLFLLEWSICPGGVKPELPRPSKILIKKELQPTISPLTVARTKISQERKETSKEISKAKRWLRNAKREL